MPSVVQALVRSFRPCFTAPGFGHFARLLSGWMLLRGSHTLSRVLQASSVLAGRRHHAAFYRFLSEGRWVLDEVGRVMFRLLRPWLSDRVVVIVDDTLCPRSGAQVFGAGMHFDGARSRIGPKRIDAFRFGHNWVVLAVWVACPWRPDSGWALPVLFRLYRAKANCARSPYRKRSDLAAEMIGRLASWLAEDQCIYVVGDGAYCCHTVLQALPARVFMVGHLRLDSALYEVPQGRNRRGRPRQKGYRIASPRQRLDNPDGWSEFEMALYGSATRLEIWTAICVWYPSAGSRPVRVVGTRDPKRRFQPRAFVCTDPELDVGVVLELYGRRWQIEVTFRDIKQELGFGDPRNGWWRRRHGVRADPKNRSSQQQLRRAAAAALRTAPLAGIAYALVVRWYLEHGRPERDVTRVRRRAPWYRRKRHPSFADMLAALRRSIWSECFRRMRLTHRIRQKLEHALSLAGVAA
jgi:hypothetical protein